MLRMARTLLYGQAPQPAAPMADLRHRELLALAPLLALILWLGVWPAPLMSKVEPAVAQLAGQPAGKTPTLSRTAAAGGAGHGR
jgi:NADH-quinone oxidoreductase subunit M